MKSAIKVTIIYIIFSSAWILFSDRLINVFTNNILILTRLSSLKGLFFVIVTGLILYLLVRNEINSKNDIISRLDEEVKIKGQLIRELHHRIRNNLQAVLGLIHIEIENSDRPEIFKERITKKIISMVSIFNIVYSMNDLSNISIEKVLEEYKANRKWDTIIIRNITDIKYSIETITSCILLIDTIIESCFRINGDSLRFELSFPKEGFIILTMIRKDGAVNFEVDKDSLDFIDVQLQSIDGSITFEKENGKIIISFEDKY